MTPGPRFQPWETLAGGKCHVSARTTTLVLIVPLNTFWKPLHWKAKCKREDSKAGFQVTTYKQDARTSGSSKVKSKNFCTNSCSAVHTGSSSNNRISNTWWKNKHFGNWAEMEDKANASVWLWDPTSARKTNEKTKPWISLNKTFWYKRGQACTFSSPCSC